MFNAYPEDIRAWLRAKGGLEKMFDDDPIAQKMLMGMADGTRGEDLERANSGPDVVISSTTDSDEPSMRLPPRPGPLQVPK
jgi:hypothetical protein